MRKKEAISFAFCSPKILAKSAAAVKAHTSSSACFILTPPCKSSFPRTMRRNVGRVRTEHEAEASKDARRGSGRAGPTQFRCA
jgi:hypothetical protein